MNNKALHIVIEFFDCQDTLDDVRSVQLSLQKAIKQTQLTTLHSYFHRFRPCGVTGVILLRESHLSIHTWPEDGYAAIDLFTCGSRADALRACRSLIKSLKPRKVKRREIVLGISR